MNYERNAQLETSDVQRWKRFKAYGQLSFLVILITALVYLTGGPLSPFLFLYLPLIMAAALYVSRAGALCFSGISVLAYCGLILAMKYGWFRNADGSSQLGSPTSGILLQIVGLSSAMVLIAVATSYLSKILLSAKEQEAHAKRDLAELSSKQEGLISNMRNIEEQLALQDRMARLLAQPKQDYSTPTYLGEFLGESQVMQKIFALIERVASSDATVLVHGESGTGKELAALAIHRGSSRARGPFVPVNCGAIPESLIESELFGHKKGAFTSAHADAPGLFRQASGGTIFLDEIGELPLNMQAKLLRAIQDRSVHPVGGDRDIPIDVRIVAATNKNLKQQLQEGRFREDLFYRLNVISISLPPLRERKEDIPVLVHALLRGIAGVNAQLVVPPQTMQLLVNYDYPGNVRELENILERAFVLGGEVFLPEHLPDVVKNYKPVDGINGASTTTSIIIDENISLPVNLDSILSNLEKRYLEVALIKTDGAKKQAAELLGMNFRSFRYRLHKFGISDEGE